ncbi:hypothetical protein BLNAU_1578 [Blattamonas nauphoetae]|uniref:Uncharacterized protein n=1 Tax=Blattamonas nauphoetae TaxID=2049346 RepID=A0ABQ9YIE8_9EUKA|nr:hypothetical protein BLNAU_1578 [Blattamonas nauphoetae]
MDCSAFLNWDECQNDSVREQAVVFRSLVATLKFQPALDASLETKAVIFLQYVTPHRQISADALLCSFAQIADKSSTNFIQSIMVLISSPNQAITTAAIQMLDRLFMWCSVKVRLALVKADLIPQLNMTLNPQSLSFAEAENIHNYLTFTIAHSLCLATPDGLAQLEIEDDEEYQAVHETVFQQVIAPSEKYICRLCADRFSIIDGDQSDYFMILLTRLLRISPYHQPTMEFVLHMPVFLAIPSCLTFFESDSPIWNFLSLLVGIQRKWNKQGGVVGHMGKKMHRMLRMEGIEDGIAEKLQNDQNEYVGQWIVDISIRWNNLQGMNLPERW